MSGLNRLPTRSDYTEEAVWARLSPVVLNDNAIMVVYVRDEFHDREELTRAIRALADYRGQELRLVGFRTTLGCDQHAQYRALAGLKRCRWIMTVTMPSMIFAGICPVNRESTSAVLAPAAMVKCLVTT